MTEEKKKEEVTICEIQEIQSAKIRQIDEEANNAVFFRQNESFLRWLFPKKAEREVAKHELRLATTEFEFREKALKISRDAQLRSLQEIYDLYLLKGTDHIEKEKKSIAKEKDVFAKELQNGFEKEIERLTDEFNKNLIERFEKIEKIPIPELKKKNLEDVHEVMESYFSMSLRLRKKFENILSEGIQE